MLGLLRGTPVGELLDLVSPRFFDVIPARALRSMARELWRNHRDRQAFAHMVAAVSPVADRLDVELTADARGGPTKGTDDAQAEAALRLYFAQLLHGRGAILDLRARAFDASGGGRVRWRPAPIYLTWQPDFAEAVRSLYVGFYEEGDERFRAALQSLGLASVETQLREHFGADQGAVEFDAERFGTTFHEIFTRCRDDGVVLPADFVALGIYLGSLYEHLSGLDRTFDVRRAFEEARACGGGTPPARFAARGATS